MSSNYGSSGDEIVGRKGKQQLPVDNIVCDNSLFYAPLLFGTEEAVTERLDKNGNEKKLENKQDVETVLFHTTDICDGSSGGGIARR